MKKDSVISFMNHFTDKDDIKLVVVENGIEYEYEVSTLVLNESKIYLSKKKG
jgi:hypothetical protein